MQLMQLMITIIDIKKWRKNNIIITSRKRVTFWELIYFICFAFECIWKQEKTLVKFTTILIVTHLEFFA